MKIVMDKECWEKPDRTTPHSVVFIMDSVEAWDCTEEGGDYGLTVGFTGGDGAEFDIHLEPEEAAKLVLRLQKALLRAAYGENYND